MVLAVPLRTLSLNVRLMHLTEERARARSRGARCQATRKTFNNVDSRHCVHCVPQSLVLAVKASIKRKERFCVRKHMGLEPHAFSSDFYMFSKEIDGLRLLCKSLDYLLSRRISDF